MRIYTRSEWAAATPQREYDPLFPTALLLHHTVSPGNGEMTFQEECAAQRAMQRAHILNGWGDIGQHFTIFQSGRIFAGIPTSVKGIHAKGANSYAIGVEWQGNFQTIRPPAPQWAAGIELYAYMCRKFGISVDRIWGHRDVTATACPGAVLYTLLGTFRRDVSAALSGRGNDDYHTEDSMFDTMSGGWLQPGETDIIDFDIGPGNPAGAAKAATFDVYVKARSLQGRAKVFCRVLAMNNSIKPATPYWVGDITLENPSDDTSYVPECGLRNFAISRGFDVKDGFMSGHAVVINQGTTPVKVWRSKYVGPK